MLYALGNVIYHAEDKRYVFDILWVWCDYAYFI